MAKEIRSLTGIRGLAACYVVMYHFHAVHGIANGSGFGPASALYNGYLAVDLFFVLSGFVMALSYGRLAHAGWTRKSYGKFLLRRMARIYPLYVLMLLLITVPVIFGISKAFQFDGLQFMENLTLIQAWGLSESINPSSWSISTEFAAYLLFPLLTLLTLTGKWPKAIAVFLAALVAIYFLQFVTTPQGVEERDGQLDIFWMPSMLPLLRCISEFTLGLVTYRLSVNDAVRRWMGKNWVAYLVTLALLAAIFTANADIETVALLPAFLLVLAVGGSMVTRVMGSPVIFFLGEISYSLYLVHGELMRVRRIGIARLAPYLGDKMADLVALTLMYGATILLSWLTYRCIEKPCRRWIRQLEIKIWGRDDAIVSPAPTILPA